MIKIESWTSNTLFQGLDEQQLQKVSPFVQEGSFEENDVIMQEGDIGDFMLMIDEGKVNIYKDELKLAERGPGDLVGLMSLMDKGPRSATVSAGEGGVKGYIIKQEGLQSIMDDEANSTVSTMLLNYIRYQQGAIRQTNDLSLQEARAKLVMEQKRVESARFFVQMVMGLIVFTFLLGFLQEKANQVDSTFISFSVLAIYGIWSYFYVKMSKIPLELFGLTMKNFKPALLLVLRSTGIFLVLMVVLKWVLITVAPDQYGTALFDIYKSDGEGGISPWLIAFLYSLHAIIQEFIARGCIQGGLLQFIVGKRSAWTAIVIATMMFSTFHLMMDMRFALATIVPGLFWGWLFYKERNILAVSISHIIIGLTAIFILNLV
jgi:CRP-like cAMP-binding protein